MHIQYENQEWITRPFEPLPKGYFRWKKENQLKQGRVGFILDTGSQLNIMNTKDATSGGIDVESLPDIELHIMGVAGKMTANWKRFRVHLQSESTGIMHLEEIYLSPEVKDNLLSYETLK